jgi:hypothetical protein
MREGAESESILVGIVAFEQKLANEISAAHVVDEVAKFRAAEGIVAKILDDGAAVGVGMGFGELFFGEFRKSLEEKGTKRVLPEKIDDFFMSEDGIGKRAAAG